VPYYATHDADDIINEDIDKRSISEKIHADTSSVPVYKKQYSISLRSLANFIRKNDTTIFFFFFLRKSFCIIQGCRRNEPGKLPRPG
jgi:hypothetical protein